MANFSVGSAGNNVTGTETGDVIELVSGFKNSTVDGLAGADTLKISSTSFQDSTVYLRGGDDTVTATQGGSADIKSSTLILGAGDDTFTFDANSAGINNSTIRGNEGQDTIAITFTGLSATASSLDIQANQGNDTITITSDESLRSALIGGGAGADTIKLTGAGSLQDSTLAGGFGEDTISAVQDFDSSLIRLGQGSNVETDSADTLVLSGLIRNTTIKGGNGDDTISANFEANSTSSVIEGNAGNDDIVLTATGVASAFEVRGGAGNDTILVVGSAGLNQSGEIYGGDGDDVISAAWTGYNIQGGVGADTMEWEDSAVNYDWTEGDSILGSMDNIELSGAAATNTVQMTFASAVTSKTATSYTAVATDDVASADVTVISGGFVNFTGTTIGSADISAAVGVLDAALSTGEAVIFVMSAANMVGTDGDDLYFFAKGSTDDTVVKFGSAMSVLSADSGHFNMAAGTSAEDLTITI